jgi:hypothetical protein
MGKIASLAIELPREQPKWPPAPRGAAKLPEQSNFSQRPGLGHKWSNRGAEARDVVDRRLACKALEC